jgi:hypothetical protein
MLMVFQVLISERRFANIGVTLLFSLVLAVAVSAQTTASLQEPAKAQGNTPKPSAPRQLVATIFKDVKIGTDRAEVKQILGKPKIDADDGFFFDNDGEIVQIRLDDKKKVRLISVTYSGDISRAPKYSDVFGSEPANVKPDGSVYSLIRYPDAGYWISFSRTAGDRPSVTVTMQKL